MSYPDWTPPVGPLFDDDGYFVSAEAAAFHAIVFQGGFSDPWIEAARMIKDGGVLAERGQAFLDANPQ